MTVDSRAPAFRSTRRVFLGQAAGSALLASLPASAGTVARIPAEPLISVWEHAPQVDIAATVKEVGFNTVWTHDKPYDGSFKLEDTLMYRHLRAPGIKYVIAKVERGIWRWTFDQAMRHTEWIAELSKTQKQIVGLYLNDLYDEMATVEKGGHTEQQFRQIIARAKSINPDLPIWVPCYPPGELAKAYYFDIDAVIFSFYNTKVLGDHEKLLDQALAKFKGKPLMGSVYLNAGSERRWLTEEEYKQLLAFFVDDINQGKLCGLRIFRVQNLIDKPEYARWAAEAIAKIKRRS
jgi:hypothetical protein